MAQRPQPGDRVRYWHRHLDTADEGFQTGVIWSNGPRTDTWWIIPDNPNNPPGDLVQGCYEARSMRLALLTRFGADAREVA